MQIAKTMAAYIALATTLALSAPVRSEIACFEDDLYSFIVAFQNNPTEQKNMSADQIEMTVFQEMGPAMPARYVQWQSKNDLNWPILPSLSELNRQDLRVRIYLDTPARAELSAEAMDEREVSFMWHFEKNPCWTFVGFTDGSLFR